VRACEVLDTLALFNTHWDHESPKSRVESARMIAKLAERALADESEPPAVLLLGDLNEPAPDRVNPAEDSVGYAALLRSGFKDLVSSRPRGAFGPRSTYVGFFYDARGPGGRVDHIMARVNATRGIGAAAPLAGVVPTEDDRGALLSDHRPVLADVVFAPAPARPS